jgi:acyl-CoA thioester hydrolase
MPQKPQPPTGVLNGGEHLFPIRVYFEDTDAEGIVYYANYLKFFERGRSESFNVAGIDLASLMEEDVIFVVRRCELDYLKPAKLCESIVIHSIVTEIKGASFSVEQVARRDGEDLCRAVVRVGTIDNTGKVARIPKWVKEKIATKLMLPV